MNYLDKNKIKNPKKKLTSNAWSKSNKIPIWETSKIPNPNGI